MYNSEYEKLFLELIRAWNPKETLKAVLEWPGVGVKTSYIPPPLPSPGFFRLKVDVDFHWEMDKKEGKKLYSQLIEFYKKLIEILDVSKNLINQLAVPAPYKVDTVLKIRVKNTRQIIPKDVQGELNKILDEFIEEFGNSISDFNSSLQSGTFPIMDFFSDINPKKSLDHFIDFLEIDSGTFRGDLFDLIYRIIRHNIEAFDDTVHSPQTQLDKASYKGTIKHIDVSKYDQYYGKRDEAFNKFIKLLKEKENALTESFNQQNSIDLVFTILAQNDLVQEYHNWIKGLSYACTAITIILKLRRALNPKMEEIYGIFERLVDVIGSYSDILSERYCGDLIVEGKDEKGNSKDKEGNQIVIGDIGYLSKVSHSISRGHPRAVVNNKVTGGKWFPYQVNKELKKNLDSPLKKNVR